MFLFFIYFSSLSSIAAANAAPDDIPPAIPSSFANFLEYSKAELLLIDNTLSTISRSRIEGIKPAPIP